MPTNRVNNRQAKASRKASRINLLYFRAESAQGWNHIADESLEKAVARAKSFMDKNFIVVQVEKPEWHQEEFTPRIEGSDWFVQGAPSMTATFGKNAQASFNPDGEYIAESVPLKK
jgi:hypothetical protein